MVVWLGINTGTETFKIGRIGKANYSLRSRGMCCSKICDRSKNISLLRTNRFTVTTFPITFIPVSMKNELVAIETSNRKDAFPPPNKKNGKLITKIPGCSSRAIPRINEYLWKVGGH